MAAPSRIEHLDPSRRVEDAWETVRQRRHEVWEAMERLAEAEAILDVERKRETPGAQRLLTTREAAGQLGISLTKLERAIRRGECPTTRLGRNVRLSEADIAQYVAGVSRS